MFVECGYTMKSVSFCYLKTIQGCVLSTETILISSFVFHSIIITKSKVCTANHCVGLSHETNLYAVCSNIFVYVLVYLVGKLTHDYSHMWVPMLIK